MRRSCCGNFVDLPGGFGYNIVMLIEARLEGRDRTKEYLKYGA